MNDKYVTEYAQGIAERKYCLADGLWHAEYIMRQYEAEIWDKLEELGVVYAPGDEKTATPLGRSWWVLSMSELHTKDSESGSWLTPRAIYGEHPGITDPSHLSGQALMWPTPTAKLEEPAAPKPGVAWWLQSRSSRNLKACVYWSTPTATEYGSNQGGAAGRKGEKRESIQRQVWNTPRSRDWKGKGKDCLPSQLHEEPINTNGRSQGRLNADWVEQLMGFPVGWTNIELKR